jgi:exopolyphosphatase / guanosine-5'-triphosphate,3'-diphosphate pyrophosphatase
MRIAVLDIGSNTGHLLVVDAHAGAAPVPAYSYKEPLRLAEHLDRDGGVSAIGISSLTRFVASALAMAEDKGCQEVLGFATSAVRDASNAELVLDHVLAETGVRIDVLPGEDEARLTFLAVRRWFGWSSGRLLVFDIGGGSLELASGADEAPQVARSLPLGAGRLTRDWLPEDVPDEESVRQLRKKVRADVAHEVGAVLRAGGPDRAAATSKTFRSLARVCGAAPYADGPMVRRTLSAQALRDAIPRLAAMSPARRAHLPGVSPSRAHQLLAGALVAEAAMDLFEVPDLEICPWALREGVILERLDRIGLLGS